MAAFALARPHCDVAARWRGGVGDVATPFAPGDVANSIHPDDLRLSDTKYFGIFLDIAIQSSYSGQGRIEACLSGER